MDGPGAVGYSAFCVFVECLLNRGGLLVWEYPWWNFSFGGVWLIFLVGYFYFFAGAIFVVNLKSLKSKLITVGAIYAVPVVMNVFGLGIMKWAY